MATAIKMKGSKALIFDFVDDEAAFCDRRSDLSVMIANEFVELLRSYNWWVGCGWRCNVCVIVGR